MSATSDGSSKLRSLEAKQTTNQSHNNDHAVTPNAANTITPRNRKSRQQGAPGKKVDEMESDDEDEDEQEQSDEEAQQQSHTGEQQSTAATSNPPSQQTSTLIASSKQQQQSSKSHPPPHSTTSSSEDEDEDDEDEDEDGDMEDEDEEEEDDEDDDDEEYVRPVRRSSRNIGRTNSSTAIATSTLSNPHKRRKTTPTHIHSIIDYAPHTHTTDAADAAGHSTSASPISATSSSTPSGARIIPASEAIEEDIPIRYKRDGESAALSVIHCGINQNGVRKYRIHDEFFSSVIDIGGDEHTIPQPLVNVYTAENDSHRRILFCCGDLAKRFSSSGGNDAKRMNKVGMWMSRRKMTDGIYQATAFQHKEQGPDSKIGLKTSGYFFTLEIAKLYQQHVISTKKKRSAEIAVPLTKLPITDKKITTILSARSVVSGSDDTSPILNLTNNNNTSNTAAAASSAASTVSTAATSTASDHLTLPTAYSRRRLTSATSTSSSTSIQAAATHATNDYVSTADHVASAKRKRPFSSTPLFVSSSDHPRDDNASSVPSTASPSTAAAVGSLLQTMSTAAKSLEQQKNANKEKRKRNIRANVHASNIPFPHSSFDSSTSSKTPIQMVSFAPSSSSSTLTSTSAASPTHSNQSYTPNAASLPTTKPDHIRASSPGSTSSASGLQIYKPIPQPVKSTNTYTPNQSMQNNNPDLVNLYGVINTPVTMYDPSATRVYHRPMVNTNLNPNVTNNNPYTPVSSPTYTSLLISPTSNTPASATSSSSSVSASPPSTSTGLINLSSPVTPLSSIPLAAQNATYPVNSNAAAPTDVLRSTLEQTVLFNQGLQEKVLANERVLLSLRDQTPQPTLSNSMQLPHSTSDSANNTPTPMHMQLQQQQLQIQQQHLLQQLQQQQQQHLQPQVTHLPSPTYTPSVQDQSSSNITAEYNQSPSSATSHPTPNYLIAYPPPSPSSNYYSIAVITPPSQYIPQQSHQMPKQSQHQPQPQPQHQLHPSQLRSAPSQPQWSPPIQTQIPSQQNPSLQSASVSVPLTLLPTAAFVQQQTTGTNNNTNVTNPNSNTTNNYPLPFQLYTSSPSSAVYTPLITPNSASNNSALSATSSGSISTPSSITTPPNQLLTLFPQSAPTAHRSLASEHMRIITFTPPQSVHSASSTDRNRSSNSVESNSHPMQTQQTPQQQFPMSDNSNPATTATSNNSSNMSQ